MYVLICAKKGVQFLLLVMIRIRIQDPEVKMLDFRFRTWGHCWEVLLVGAGCRVAMVRLKESKLDKKKCDKCDHRRL